MQDELLTLTNQESDPEFNERALCMLVNMWFTRSLSMFLSRIDQKVEFNNITISFDKTEHYAMFTFLLKREGKGVIRLQHRENRAELEAALIDQSLAYIQQRSVQIADHLFQRFQENL